MKFIANFMTICIIPARSNSQRLKNKNFINFYGKSIISYVIETAKKSKIFSKIIVSTDSKKIASIAKKCGAEVPFIRSKKLSDNFTTSKEVVIDCIKKISSQKNAYHCCIYPTAVLTKVNDLKKSFNKIKKLKADYLIAITDFEYSPIRSLQKRGKNWIKFKEKKYINSRSQDLKTLYHDTGSFYFYKTSVLLKKRKNLPKKTTYYFIDRTNTVDINSASDLKMAKLKFRLLKEKNG